MIQPTMECVDSLTIDDVARQAVPESRTGHTECSVADSRKPHSRYLQSMCPHWSWCLLGMSATRIRSSTTYWGANPCNDLKINITSLNCMRSDAHSQWRLTSITVRRWAQIGGDDTGKPGFRSGWLMKAEHSRPWVQHDWRHGQQE